MTPTAKGVTDLLQSHEKLSKLLPAAHRIAELQKACAAALPVLFETCSVIQFEAGQLMIAAPNAGIVSKLKNQLPNLQLILQKQGWQVNAIRLKVQVGKISEKSTTSKQLILPSRALLAFETLENTLESSPRNAALKAALQAMVERHRKDK